MCLTLDEVREILNESPFTFLFSESEVEEVAIQIYNTYFLEISSDDLSGEQNKKL